MTPTFEKGFDELVKIIPTQPIEAAEQSAAQNEGGKSYNSDMDALCGKTSEIEVPPTVAASKKGSKFAINTSEQIGVMRSSKRENRTKQASVNPYARPLKEVIRSILSKAY